MNEAPLEVTTADLAHVNEFGTYKDRDAMLDEIWPGVGKSWTEDLQIFGRHPDFMVRYRVVGGERPPRNMAEHIHFEGDGIAAIEVFIGREAEEGQCAWYHLAAILGSPCDGE